MGWNPFKRKRTLSRSLIKEAQSTRFLHDGKIPSDPEKSLKKAETLIKKAGYKFVRRSSKHEHGRKFTMTLRRRIALSGRWDTYSVDKKAEILWHELVHIRQRKEWGHAKFLRYYISAEGRWKIEVPAYRESIRVKKVFAPNHKKQDILNYSKAKAKSMRSDYKLQKLDYDQYMRETQKVWNKEAA